LGQACRAFTVLVACWMAARHRGDALIYVSGFRVLGFRFRVEG